MRQVWFQVDRQPGGLEGGTFGTHWLSPSVVSGQLYAASFSIAFIVQFWL